MGCFGAGCHRGLSATSGRGRFGARRPARSVSARGVSGVPDLVVYLHDGHLVVNAGDLVRLCARQGCPGSQQRLAHHSNDFRVYRRCSAGDGGRVAVSRDGCIVVSHFRLRKARHPFGHPRGRIRRCWRRFFLTCANYTERHADLQWIVNSPANRTRNLLNGFLLLYKQFPRDPPIPNFQPAGQSMDHPEAGTIPALAEPFRVNLHSREPANPIKAE